MSKQDDILHYHEPNGNYVPVSRTEQAMAFDQLAEQKRMEEEKGDGVVIMEEVTEEGKPIQDNEIISLPNREYGVLNYYIETGLENVLNDDINNKSYEARQRNIALIREFSQNAVGAQNPSRQYDYTDDLIGCQWKVEDLETIRNIVIDLLHMNQRNEYAVVTNTTTGKEITGLFGLSLKYKDFLTRSQRLYYSNMVASPPIHGPILLSDKGSWVTLHNKDIDCVGFSRFKGFFNSQKLENDLKAFLSRLNYVIDYLKKYNRYPELKIGNNCYSNPDYLFGENRELLGILPFEASVLQEGYYKDAYLPYERIQALIHQFIGKDNYIILSSTPNLTATRSGKNGFYCFAIYMDIYGNFQLGEGVFKSDIQGGSNHGANTYAQRLVAQRIFPVFKSFRQEDKDAALALKHLTTNPDAMVKFVGFMQKGGMRAIADSIRRGYTLIDRPDDKKPKKNQKDKGKPIIQPLKLKDAGQIKLAIDRQKKLENIPVGENQHIGTDITSDWRYISDNEVQITLKLNDTVREDEKKEDDEGGMEIDDIDDILSKFDQEEKEEQPEQSTSFADAANKK